MFQFPDDMAAPVPTLAVRRPPQSNELPEKGKVQLGGMGPCFTPPAIADTGKVKMGGMGPTF